MIRIISKVRRWIRIKTLIEGILLSFSILMGLVIVLGILDYSISLNSKIRLYFLIGLIISIIILLVKFIMVPLLSSLSENKIALKIQKRYPVLRDDLINSIQLFPIASSAGEVYVSKALIGELITRTSQKVRIVNTFKVEDMKRLKKFFFISLSVFLIFSFLLFFPPRILPFSLPRLLRPLDYEQVNRMLRITPGNVEVLYGESQEIAAEIFQRGGTPYLIYKISGGNWQRAKMVREAYSPREVRKFSYKFSQVTHPIDYFIKWKDLRTQAYSISVVVLPEVGDISLKYIYPSYTRLPELKVEKTSGDLEALLGTQVQMTLKANKPIRKGFLLTDDGKRLPLKIERDLYLKEGLVLTGERVYWVEVEDNQGYTNPRPIKHYIRTLLDSPPQIKIIAPGSDLTVSEKSKVELAYEASDDFGLTQIDLVYQKLRGESYQSMQPERKRIERFEPAVGQKLRDYQWELENLQLRPGELISYYLEAWDNDAISGPKSSLSQTYYLEVFSYLKEHEEIEQMEHHFREEILRILGDQILAKGRVEDWEEIQGVEELKSIQADQGKIEKSTEDLLKYLQKLLPRMEADPLGNSQVYAEYENMEGNLQYLKDEKMAEVLSKISEAMKATSADRKEHMEKVKNGQEEIISELEKMSLLAENLLQDEKMRDVLGTAQELLDNQSDLTQKLEEMGKEIDKQKLEELKKSLAEITKLMAKLAKSLSQLPETLPEEFINQDAVKSLQLGEMAGDIEKMADQILKGDLEAALNIAKNLLKTLSSTMAVLQAAANQVPSFGKSSQLSQQVNLYSQELEKLIAEEKKLIERTNQLDKKRLEALFKKQEALLKKLAKLQEGVIREAKELQENLKDKLKYIKVYPALYQNLSIVLRRMEEVLSELSQETPRRARELLKETIGRLNGMSGIIDNFILQVEKEKQKISIELSKLSEEKEEEEELTPQQKSLLSMRENWEAKERDISETGEKTTALREKEEEIAKLLEFEQEVMEVFEEKDLQELENLAKKQKELESRTGGLRQKLEELSGKTSAIGPQIISNMEKASSAMDKASGELEKKKTEPALEKEREALYYLAQGKEGLASASKKLMEIAKRAGKPFVGFLQPRGGTLPGGRMGFREGYVKIPEAHEYQPPEEFRQELLEALKEKYPEIYEQLIKQYYRRLTE
ncbi:DUF4175 family protein [bacterium]|nr:DUF4175 family protein [bacterium]